MCHNLIMVSPMTEREDEHKGEKLGRSLDYLRSAALFSNLSDEEIAYFDDAAQMRAYKKGKILYLQEETADYFYVICEGWIKLFHTMPEGEEVVVDMLTTGHMVGESAIFEQSHYTSSAQVVECVQLLSIPSSLLNERLRHSPMLALSMLSSMSQHHRRHYAQIAINATQSAPQRIGCFLLRTCPINKQHGVVLHLPYDKALIASTLGMESATFSRALNILRQKTGVRVIGTRVEIDTIKPLIRFVYGNISSKDIP